MPLLPTSLEGLDARERDEARKREVRALRIAEQKRQRPDLIARVNNAQQVGEQLVSLRTQLADEHERHNAVVAELETLISGLDRELKNIPNLVRILIETAGEAGLEYTRLNGDLESLLRFLAEPPPAPPTILRGIEGNVRDFASITLPKHASQESLGRKAAAEFHAKRLDEHDQRTESARREVSRLRPLVARVRALVLTPNPTPEQLEEILAEHER